MARRKKEEYTVTAHYTEGCEKRLTEALVDIYYNRKRGISGPQVKKPQNDDPA